MADDENNMMLDSPFEVLASLANSGGDCSAQSVLPTDDGYVCHCACGTWDVTTETREDGLAQARAHTLATIGM